MNLIAIAIVFFTVASVLLLEKTESKLLHKILDWVPPILFAYIIPAILTHTFGLDLSKVSLHNLSKEFIMPFAIVLVMSALSFLQLRKVGWKPILVFVSGSLAVAVLPIIMLLAAKTLFPDVFRLIIDDNYWQGMVTIVGSWVGGSTSQLILKEVVSCPEGIFLAILIMDNVLVNIWTIFMFQSIKKSDSINQFLKINDPIQDWIADDYSHVDMNSNVLTIMLSLAPVVLLIFLPIGFLFKIILLSFIGLAYGNFISKWNHELVIKLGGVMIILIMAILGLKLNFSNFSLPIPIIVFSIIWIFGHYIVMFLVAYILRLNMAWIAIASMANVGGISTAPAVTKAYHEEWMPHAILLAILSMVTGTYWGLVTISLINKLFI